MSSDFKGAVLQSSNFQFSALYSAKLDSTDLSDCDFRNISLSNCTFSGANLQDVKAFLSQKNEFILCDLSAEQLEQIDWIEDPNRFQYTKPNTWFQ